MLLSVTNVLIWSALHLSYMFLCETRPVRTETVQGLLTVFAEKIDLCYNCLFSLSLFLSLIPHSFFVLTLFLFFFLSIP